MWLVKVSKVLLVFFWNVGEGLFVVEGVFWIG